MYAIVNIINVKREFLAAFVAGVQQHAAASNQEPGCLRYDVLQEGENPSVICLYEVFADEAAFQAHLKTPHYKEWMEASRSWRESFGRQRWVMDHVFWRSEF